MGHTDLPSRPPSLPPSLPDFLIGLVEVNEEGLSQLSKAL